MTAVCAPFRYKFTQMLFSYNLDIYFIVYICCCQNLHSGSDVLIGNGIDLNIILFIGENIN